MNNTIFKKVVDAQIAECLDIMRLKGADYPMDNSDRLSNFKHSGRRAGVDPLQAWLVFFLKHEECIEKFVRGEYADSEPINSRIADAINYLMLLRALIEERREQSTNMVADLASGAALALENKNIPPQSKTVTQSVKDTLASFFSLGNAGADSETLS